MVITGASRGIGEETARHFASQGANVTLIARSREEIENIADEIGENARAVACDVADCAVLQGAIDAVATEHGRLDVLINNAAILGPLAPIAQADPDLWSQTIDVNLKGVFYGTQAALRPMIAQGGGTVITISSGAAHNPVDPWSAYCASKAGAYMLTRMLHHEYGPKGIRALGLSPGTVATNMQRDIKASGLGPVARLDWSDHIPPEWPARALIWMCGPEADPWLGDDISLRDENIRRQVGLI